MYLQEPKPGQRPQQLNRDFILLFAREIGVGQEIRCLVRKVRLEPFGNFMVDHVQLATNTRTKLPEITVSGSYGNMGFPIDATEGNKDPVGQFWDSMHVLPQALADKVWKDNTGHNGAGVTGEDVREWALPRAAMLSKWLRVEDLYAEAQAHIDRGTLVVYRAAQGLGLKPRTSMSAKGIRSIKGLPTDENWFHKQVCKYMIRTTKKWANVVMPEEWRDKV